MLEFPSFDHLFIYQLVNEEMKRVLVDLCEAVRFVCSVQFFRMAVLWTLSLIFSYLQLWFFRKSQAYPRCSPAQNPLMKRPICVVTGATSGLGAAAAYALSKEGFYVVLAGRCNEKLSKMMKEIKQQQPDAQLKAFQVDLSSFQSILKFKNSLQQWLMDLDTHPSIQLLINNAGILSTSHRFTAEGYDQMIGTNYIGAFSLTNLLLPLLESSSIPSRIVNVSSFTHRCVSDIQVDEETLAGNFSVVSKQYPYAQIYEYTKFCLLLFSYTLHRQQCLVDKSHQLSVIAVDPGVVETNIMREIPPLLSFMAVMVLRFLGLSQSPESGVDSIIDAALAPPEISGQYFFGGRGRVLKSSALSYDSILAEKLWSSSRKLFVKQQLAFKEAS